MIRRDIGGRAPALRVDEEARSPGLTIGQARRQLGRSRRAIYRMIIEGSLPGTIEHRRILVDAEAVHTLAVRGGVDSGWEQHAPAIVISLAAFIAVMVVLHELTVVTIPYYEMLSQVAGVVLGAAILLLVFYLFFVIPNQGTRWQRARLQLQWSMLWSRISQEISGTADRNLLTGTYEGKKVRLYIEGFDGHTHFIYHYWVELCLPFPLMEQWRMQRDKQSGDWYVGSGEHRLDASRWSPAAWYAVRMASQRDPYLHQVEYDPTIPALRYLSGITQRRAPCVATLRFQLEPLLRLAVLIGDSETGRPPAFRPELVGHMVAHEKVLWMDTASGLDMDDTLLEQVVTLASLAGADNEAEAVALLRLLPELADAGVDRLEQVARWVHDLYPGPRWWNPITPDFLAEHLVVKCYAAEPGVLAGALHREDSASLIQPVDILARAGARHPEFATALRPVLSPRLKQLCLLALGNSVADTQLPPPGGTTLLNVLNRLLQVVSVDPAVLPGAADQFSGFHGPRVAPLAATLAEQLVAMRREQAQTDPETYAPLFVESLVFLSSRLREAGRMADSRVPIDETVFFCQRLRPETLNRVRATLEELSGRGRT